MQERIPMQRMFLIVLFHRWWQDLLITCHKNLEWKKTQPFKLLYEDELARALQEDGSAASTYITPKAYYPNI